MRYKGIIFDVNHTLVGISQESEVQEYAVGVLFREIRKHSHLSFSEGEFRRAYAEAWNSAKRGSYESLREVRYEAVVGQTVGKFGLTFSADEMEHILQRYMEPLYQASFVIPGMRELMLALRPRFRLGALTNYKYSSGIRTMLAKLKLDDLVDVLVVSSEVGWKKPAPKIYNEMVQQLEVAPTECISVGNELEKDLWQARKLGMATILFEPREIGLFVDTEVASILRERIGAQELKCDYIARSVPELAGILTQINDMQPT